MRYKVGDKVLIKSLDWYYENRDKIDQIDCGNVCFVRNMATLCGKIVTISSILPVLGAYRIKEDDGEFNWTDEMIERLVERDGKTYPYKIGDRVVLKGKNRCATITDLKYNSSGKLSYYIKIDNDKDNSIDYPTDLLLPYDSMKTETHRGYSTTDVETTNESKTVARFTFDYNDDDNDFANKVELDLSNCELIQEDGKWFVVKKKNEYPKTYKECAKIMGVELWNTLWGEDATEYEEQMEDLINTFIRLKVCRDAYWKIAGEEMGLGKPWKPDWKDNYQKKWIINFYQDEINLTNGPNVHFILAFPTEEMRDAFYENFKELIEICKELL